MEKDEDTRVDVMFDRLMLMELRENVSKLDSRSYSELRSYNEPPRVVQDILKAVLSIFYLEQAESGEFDDWTNVKSVSSSFYFDSAGSGTSTLVIWLEKKNLLSLVSVSHVSSCR